MSKNGKKNAFLILAHTKPKIFHQLVENLLDNENHFVFAHIDKKSRFDDFYINNCRVIYVPRIKIYWGTFSLVKATLRLLEYAVEYKCCRYTLLSGDSWPINDIDDLCNVDQEYVNQYLNFDHERLNDRMFRYHIGVHNKFIWVIDKILLKIQKFFRIKHTYPGVLDNYYIGSQWWSITYTAALKVISTYRNKRLLDFYRYVKIPDEMFVQNVVLNSEFDIIDKPFMYFGFEMNGSEYLGVRELGKVDCECVLESSAVFCRKASIEFIFYLKIACKRKELMDSQKK